LSRRAPVRSSVLASGPLRVHPANPRYFTDGSGRAIYLTGSHTWGNFRDLQLQDPPNAFDYEGYLDFLGNEHHNFIRLWAWELSPFTYGGALVYNAPFPWERPGPGNALDGKPKFDLSLWNQAYFDRLRQHVIAAGERGIYVSIMLFEGHAMRLSQAPWRWDGHPFNAANNINDIDGDPNGDGLATELHTLQIPAVTDLQKAYVRKVVDTVNDLDNVLFEICNESHSGSELWQYAMIDHLKDYEASKPSQHPVGMTVEYPGGSNADLFASNADWVSPNGEGGYQDDPPAADGSKIILTDTDHLWGIGGDRAWVWKSFTRGHNTLYMDPYPEGNPGLGFGPANQSLRDNLGYTLTFAERMDLAKMRPRGDLASTGYCLANPAAQEAEYLVYLPSGGTVTVNLSSTTGTLDVEWFNPATGQTMIGGTIQGGASRGFTAPFSGDAVLYLSSQWQQTRLAVIGDFGTGDSRERDVADQLKTWEPDAIITTGDDNYPDGEATTIDENIGQFYHEFIYPYLGSYGPGASENRFFPTLGNHDWHAPNAQPYLDYFTLPGNERYYEVDLGPVDLFAIDSEPEEPDGVSASSAQALWLEARLEASTSPWKLVYFHSPPYTSGVVHGPSEWMQWPFKEWGATAVLSGHEHHYERLTVGGLPYFVDGSGGGSLYSFGTPYPGSEVRFNQDWGAMLIDADASRIQFRFITRAGVQIDSYTIESGIPIFADVPWTHPYRIYIETLYRAGYTAGCNADPLMYCPETTMNRAESAVFVERGIHAASYTPPGATTQVFDDMPLESWAAGWVNALWTDQYTAGCGSNPLMYCPWQGHTRAEGSVFYMRMLNGADFDPPQPTQQIFADVPPGAWYAKWVHAAHGAGLLEPCETSPELRFCPEDPLSRAQAAYMMVQAKQLISP
jgi:hypothetical protein